MSSTPPAGGRLFVEPLEARIAPTGLTALANNTSSSSQPNYVTFGTLPSAGKLGFVPASHYLGASAPANLYAIALTGDGSVDPTTGLSTGDELLIFNSVTGFNPSTPFIQAADKTLVAFFLDKTNSGNPANDQVTTDELVGISLTKKSSANVNGVVNGDIVTNLSKDGTTISLTSVGRPGFSIAALNINGNVTGNILAGGNIDNVSVHGNINNIFAGTATNGHTFNFTGTAGAVTGTIAEGAFPDARTGASITNTVITSLSSGAVIHAGDGGLGAVGGGVDTLTVDNQTVGFQIVAGNGGVGNSVVKGGIGGDVSAVTVVGVALSTPNAIIGIHAGNGGENDAFKGGIGGTVTGVATSFNSFDTSSDTGVQSPDLLLQDIVVQAGTGGAGLKGGRGGDVAGSNIFSATPTDGTVNAQIQVLAGTGGAPISATAGHGGAGGSVSQVFAEDMDTNPDGATATVLVQAGDGGSIAVNGVVVNGGGSGGTLSAINLLGGELIANAGNGSNGISKGGQGGDLETINILNLANLFTHQLTLNAGSGGASSAGSGGLGGEVNTVVMNDSDLNFLAINTGTHANGGVGSNGVGGAGGGVLNITLNDNDTGGQFATVAVRSGAGGNGYLGGGDGGGISQFQMIGLNYSYTATAGAGGTGFNGAGGAGGSFDTVGFSNVPAVDGVFVGTALADVLNSTGTNYTTLTGAATAGAGGAGTTHGGDGGTLGAVDLRAGFNVALTAGAGGSGGSSTAGAGGAVNSCAGVSLGGSVTVIAGNAAGAGAVAADGGTITSTIASAQTDVTMTAGNGGAGGAGGSITSSGSTPNPIYLDTNSSDVTVPVSNFGNVTITAGAGSAANGVAGAGGSVTGFTGSVGLAGAGDFGSATTHDTVITAGAGGGGNGQTASGAGGIVDSLQLTGDNLVDQFGLQNVTVDGGNAGVSSAAKRGGAGGGVSNATIYNLDLGTIVQHVAAGDGATAFRHGGAGGTITEIHVGRPGDVTADIGVRDGVVFGYALGSAGGIFAGVGGTFTHVPVAKTTVGVNGDVTNITANAISSIVAGKTSTIHLVNEVDGIDLEGGTPAYTDGTTGAFPNGNFDTAQIVGSIYNDGNGSAGAGASTFKLGDGLIAATTITNNRNFTPEASLTYESNNPTVLAFFDLLESTQGLNANVTVTTAIPVAYSL